MLYEFYQHLSTPCPRPVKNVGYLRELIGMAARYRRCRGAWKPHLNQCQDWIVQAMDGCQGRVVVLGSGLLYDVPVRELADHFDEVILVDILHMPAVRKAVRPFTNVTLETRDITGFVGPLYRHITKGEPLPQPGPADMALGQAGLVISLNVLSQLPVLPREFAAKRGHPLDAAFGQSLMQAHVEALAQATGRVCLITETEQHLCLAGELVEKENPLAGVDIPQALKAHTKRWQWDFAPHPERHPQYDLIYCIDGFAR